MGDGKNLQPMEHIGWDLWQATQVWKQTFTRAMVARGHGWYGEARGGLFRFIGPGGIAQIDLAARAGMTKQAVQQHLDDLARDGIVTRQPDPRDGRKKRIALTGDGMAAMRDAERVKQEIEADYLRLIGAPEYQVLKSALAQIIDSQDRPA